MPVDSGAQTDPAPKPSRESDHALIESIYRIALEPQGWPDAPNNPSFPSISLAQGETYFQHTRYDLSKITPNVLSSNLDYRKPLI